MDRKGEELAAAIAEIRERVRSRHPNGTVLGDVPLPDLLPLVHARDAAEGKVASIGKVNPRPGGLVNAGAQAIKRLVSRALDWHVREQVEFNRAVMGCVQATLEALTECNRGIAMLASRVAAAAEATQQLNDLRTHWAHWRVEWEKKLASNEITLLRGLGDQHSAFQHRVNQLDTSYREHMRLQHANFEAALDRSATSLQGRLGTELEELQKRMWNDLERVRREYEQIIHAELRILRQRGSISPPPQAAVPQTAPPHAAPLHAAPLQTPPTLASDGLPSVDWLKFAERFRGSEDAIKQRQQMYAGRFRGHAPVLDIGCGRGEMLEVFRESEIEARGIDLHDESVALCRSKGLDAERADLFVYLNALPDVSLGGAVCCQVVEHLPPERLPEMIRLLHRKLRAGALVAIETPNPECLAIFATHFYLDPTHRHPLPPALMNFYLEEAGFGGVEVARLSPAIESIPSLGTLPEEFRKEFFGALDYAVFARKLG